MLLKATIMSIIILIPLSFILAPSANARMPFHTDDAYLVSGSGFHLDLNLSFEKHPGAKIITIYTDTRKGLFKYLNLTNHTPIIFRISDSGTEKGIGDITVGFKFGRPYKPGRSLYTSLKLQIKAPSGDEELGLGLPGWDIIPGASLTFCSERLELDASLSYVYTLDDRLKDRISFGTAVSLLTWGDDTTGFLINGEVFGSSNQGREQNLWDLSCAVGGTFAISRGYPAWIPMILSIGGTVGKGITDTAPEFTITSGLSFGFLYF